ncbi:alpha/beta fold hydrolase [Blastococcus sp. DSM 46786]|uniref:alpha/beta fold hydrolase n=1 Tax=Blastococcus sp. DSM 46786 TaxID=1798227 RepID=UPI001113D73F|nr:alpha/beta fold hydrolase [Blastococcus sp. DSM 46786]
MPIRRPRRAASLLVVALVAVLGLAGCAPEVVDGTIEPFTSTGGDLVGREPCPASEFECITLTVPADHRAAASPAWEVTFALRPADVEARGVLVTATGGPGSSGIALADRYTSAMDPEITDHYDLVFFDQRGIGRSEPFVCDRALSSFEEVLDASSDAGERDGYAAAAERFAGNCFAEAGVAPSDAPLFATAQAAEDLEVFRRWYGAERLVLYGESYGTQFQQAYAAAHPDRVESLVLDGVVDLQTPLRSFAAESARAYSDVLAATLAGCDAEPVCAEDGPGASAAAYDALAAELRAAPRPYDHPLADGGTEERELTLEELEGAAMASLSSPHARRQLQRALNAAAGGDELPLARLAAATAGADPETGEVAVDPSFSPALFYAVECQDYPTVPDGSTGRAELDRWLDSAAADGVAGVRLDDVYYGDLPCLFWPRGEEPVRPPAAIADPPYPLLLLTADTDPNTPAGNAQRVLERAPTDAALLVLTDGPHVLYGWGYACVDRAVTRLVTTGRLPARPVTTCTDSLAEAYVPLPPASAAGYDDPWETVDLLLAELLGPSFEAWPGTDALDLGCPAGGNAGYRITMAGAVRIALDGCAWTPGAPVDGVATVADGGTGEVTLDVTLPFAELTLSGDGNLGGTFRGERVR